MRLDKLEIEQQGRKFQFREPRWREPLIPMQPPNHERGWVLGLDEVAEFALPSVAWMVPYPVDHSV